MKATGNDGRVDDVIGQQLLQRLRVVEGKSVGQREDLRGRRWQFREGKKNMSKTYLHLKVRMNVEY